MPIIGRENGLQKWVQTVNENTCSEYACKFIMWSCELESTSCHNKDTVGKKGNGKSSHNSSLPQKKRFKALTQAPAKL